MGYSDLYKLCWLSCSAGLEAKVQQWVQTWITFTNAGQELQSRPKVGKTPSLGSEIGRTVYQALRPDWGINWFCTWAYLLAEVTSAVLLDRQLPGSGQTSTWSDKELYSAVGRAMN